MGKLVGKSSPPKAPLTYISRKRSYNQLPNQSTDDLLGLQAGDTEGTAQGSKGFALIFGDATPDETEIKAFQGYYSPWWKKLIYYLVAILTCGFSLLVAKWSPRFHILLSLAKCPLQDAQYIMITLVDGRIDLEAVTRILLHTIHDHVGPGAPVVDEGKETLLDWQNAERYLMIEYRCNRYFYVDAFNTFVPVPAVAKGFAEEVQRVAHQLAANVHASQLEDPDMDVADREMRYGTNEMLIPVQSVPMLIFNEMWHPFYCFQYFSIIVWIVGDQYYSYSVCIFVITWFSIISSAVEAHRNMKRLAAIAYFSTTVEVLRDGVFTTMSSAALVPGDIIVIKPGALPRDVVLLRGECIVDENMLTGESVPVRKVAYSPIADGLAYTPDKSTACTLYGGTQVAQARAAKNMRAIGMVCRTRFYSAKGQLLRSILFPREHSGNFISDSLIFICVMLIICVGLYIWAAVILHDVGADAERIVVRFFDMITVAVPPASPSPQSSP